MIHILNNLLIKATFLFTFFFIFFLLSYHITFTFYLRSVLCQMIHLRKRIKFLYFTNQNESQLSLEYEHLNAVIKEIFSKIISTKFLIAMPINIFDLRLN